jgi:hypothetical protein
MARIKDKYGFKNSKKERRLAFLVCASVFIRVDLRLSVVGLLSLRC